MPQDMDNFKAALKIILQLEGGYANDPDDPGGETACGITVKVARANGYMGPMTEIPMGIVTAIYHEDYWYGCASVIDDKYLSLAVFDCSVNCGKKMAVQLLQRAWNTLKKDFNLSSELTVDGILGPKTLECVNGPDGIAKSRELFDKYMSQRRYFYNAIAHGAKSKFLSGWIRRCQAIELKERNKVRL